MTLVVLPCIQIEEEELIPIALVVQMELRRFWVPSYWSHY